MTNFDLGRSHTITLHVPHVSFQTFALLLGTPLVDLSILYETHLVRGEE